MDISFPLPQGKRKLTLHDHLPVNKKRNNARPLAERFFALPRELRDMIYGYIHQPAEFHWDLGNAAYFDAGSPTFASMIVHVTVAQAPYPALLYTCMDFYEDYIQSDICTKLDIVMEMTIERKRTSRTRWLPSILESPHLCPPFLFFGRIEPTQYMARLFENARHIELLIDNLGAGGYGVDCDAWRGQYEVMAAMSPWIHELRSFRIAVHTKASEMVYDSEFDGFHYDLAAPSVMSPAMFRMSQFGLALKQSVAGCRLRVLVCDEGAFEEEETIFIGGCAHVFMTIGFVYEKQDRRSTEDKSWKQQDLLERFAIEAFESGHDDYPSGPLAELLQDLFGNKMYGWRAKTSNMLEWQSDAGVVEATGFKLDV